MITKTNQKGAVLVSSMILLLILTTIGLSSIQTSNLDIQISTNVQDRNIAFQLAESVLIEAETRIFDLEATPPVSCNFNDENGFKACFTKSGILEQGIYTITDADPRDPKGKNIACSNGDQGDAGYACLFIEDKTDPSNIIFRQKKLDKNNAIESTAKVSNTKGSNTTKSFYTIAFLTGATSNQIIITAKGRGLSQDANDIGTEVILQSRLEIK